jgi:hypothetical protein
MILWKSKATTAAASITVILLGTPGAFADDVMPPKVEMVTPGGVSIPDGSFAMHAVDLSIGPLTLDRFTQPPSQLPQNDPYFGTGITNNFDIYVAPNFQKPVGAPWNIPSRYHPVVHIGSTSVGVYAQPYGVSNPTISTLNIDARAGKLAMVSGAYVFTDSTGAIYTFNPSVQAGGQAGAASQRIANIAYPDGRIQIFTYDAGGHLKLVNDSTGYAIVFDYNAGGDVSAACGFNLSQDYVSASSTCSSASVKVVYGYTGAVLTSVTDLYGKVTGYTHQTTSTWGSPITCVTPPGYSTCKIANTVNPYGQVTQQTLADGSIWQNGSSLISQTLDPEYIPYNCDGGASVTDPNSKTSTWSLNKSSPCRFTDAYGKVTTYKFYGGVLQDPWSVAVNEGTLLLEVDFPEGNKYLAEYLGPFNGISKQTVVAKPGSGLPDLVKQYGYGDCFTSPGTMQNCSKPIWIKDTLGNQTDYTYAAWGGVLSEMEPPATTGGARPLKLYTYVQKYAYVKNSGGTLVSTGVPIWTISTMTQCQAAAGSSSPTCDTNGAAPRAQTSYEYGLDGTANNLLARGFVVTDLITGISRRTCFAYDLVGRKVSQTPPRGTASLSVCP